MSFRNILRLLIENLSDEVGATRALVFGVLTEMLKQDRLIDSFQAFTELIILKVLEAHRDEEKDVSEIYRFSRRDFHLVNFYKYKSQSRS